MPLIKHLKIQ